MVSNWDVQHFANLAAERILCRARRHLDGLLPGWPVILCLFSSARSADRDRWRDHFHRLPRRFAAVALYRLGGRWAAVAWLFAQPLSSLWCRTPNRCFAPRLLGLGTGTCRSLASAALLTRARPATVRVSGLFPRRRTARS
jgi:hypothetical protein